MVAATHRPPLCVCWLRYRTDLSNEEDKTNPRVYERSYELWTMNKKGQIGTDLLLPDFTRSQWLRPNLSSLQLQILKFKINYDTEKGRKILRCCSSGHRRWVAAGEDNIVFRINWLCSGSRDIWYLSTFWYSFQWGCDWPHQIFSGQRTDMEHLKHCRFAALEGKCVVRSRSTRLAIQRRREDFWSENDVCMAADVQIVAKLCKK